MAEQLEVKIDTAPILHGLQRIREELEVVTGELNADNGDAVDHLKVAAEWLDRVKRDVEALDS